MRARPVDERGAPAGRERRAERELVGGREQHGGRTGGTSGSAPCSSTGQRRDAQPGRGDDVAQRVQARVLQRHRPASARQQQRQPLVKPAQTTIRSGSAITPRARPR